MIDFQTKIMADRRRNDAFYRALRRIIKPGKTVVADLGSGTGFLSFLASQLGAKACYLYEKSPDLLRLSEKIAKQNRVKNCVFFNAYSTEVRSPMKADVVISETLGNAAYEEHIIEVMNDAKRFLKPGGTLMPQALEYHVAPVITSRLMEELNPWDGVGFGLNFDVMKEVSLNNSYVKTLRPGEVLAPKTWDRIRFTEKNSSIRKGAVEWILAKNVVIYGFATWWTCEVIPGVAISTSPQAKPTHWEQIFLPIDPVSLKKGEKISLELHSDTRIQVGVDFKWRVKSGQGLQTMDIVKGFID